MRREVAERTIGAPQCVEPGTDGDDLGVEGRHRSNMKKLFNFMEHVGTVLNNHADVVGA